MEEKLKRLCEENRALLEELDKYKKISSEFKYKYKTVMELSKTIICEWDIKADSVRWDRLHTDELGEERYISNGAYERWKGRIHDDDKKATVKNLDNFLNRRSKDISSIYRYKLDSGNYKWVRLQGKGIWDEEDKPLRMIVAHTDITEQKMYEEKINHLAYHDTITGLINRTLFEYKLKTHIEMNDMEEHKYNTVLICIDIDNFKAINDSRSHSFGDLVLKKVSEVLICLLPRETTIARLGGDEFVILFPNIFELEEIKKVIRSIRLSFNNPLNIDGHEMTLSVSMGVAIYPRDAKDEKDLIKNADIALYFSKKKGKSNYEFFSSDMNSSIVKNVNLENDLRNAVRNKEFVVYYQPQYSIKTGTVVGMEALVRWVHPDRGIISPQIFISILEETGLIIPVGEFVLYEACKLNKELQKKGYGYQPISVNLSARQFTQKSLVNKIDKILKSTGLEPRWLMVEITETIAMQDIDYTISVLNEIRRMGIKVALDDFGTGYSSLNYLKDLPIDILKIDKSFMDGITASPKEGAIAKAIINLAHILNLDIVAEGVENDKQIEFLKEQNCDKVQGYIYSKPIKSEEIEDKLKIRYS